MNKLNAAQVVNLLKNTPGTNDKIQIIKDNDSPELRKMFMLGLDNQYRSGIKQLPKAQGYFPVLDFSSALDALDDIYTRKYTGDAARDYLKSIFESVSEDDAHLLGLVVQKELNCGVMGTTANKAFGSKVIRDIPYMRCEVSTPKTLDRMEWPATIEVKMDSQFLNGEYTAGTETYFSRNGKEYNLMGMFTDEMKRLSEHLEPIIGPDFVLNGEIIVVDEFGEFLPRTTSNGIIQKFGKGTGNILDAMNLRYIVWDIIPTIHFYDGLWKVHRKSRRSILLNALNAAQTEKINFVEYAFVNDIHEANEFNKKQLSQNREGSVLKNENGFWKDCTSPDQIKMKLRFEVDLKVVGFESGKETGKNADSLGAVLCESSCGLLKVGIGSGWKELSTSKDIKTTRDYIWNHQDEFLGKILCAEASDVVKSKTNDTHSLFICTFVEWRFDKDTADDLKRIIDIREACIEVEKNTK